MASGSGRCYVATWPRRAAQRKLTTGGIKMRIDGPHHTTLRPARSSTRPGISSAKLAFVAAFLAISCSAASAHPSCGQPQSSVLASRLSGGVAGSKGGAHRPDGAIYVTENTLGRFTNRSGNGRHHDLRLRTATGGASKQRDSRRRSDGRRVLEGLLMLWSPWWVQM